VAIQTFADSRLGFDHAVAAKEWFNEFPGPELDQLRKKAQEHRTFIAGQCRARDSKLHPDRYLNIAFILDPEAEVLYMPSYPEPWVGMGWYEIHNRSRALDNTCYVVAPNCGAWYLNRDSQVPMDVFGGKTQIVDYMGKVVAEHQAGDCSFVSAIIDIEALRYYRANA